LAIVAEQFAAELIAVMKDDVAEVRAGRSFAAFGEREIDLCDVSAIEEKRLERIGAMPLDAGVAIDVL
jgi:hypothetical protein